MLKVIIVDDEQFIAQGLQALIDWNAAGYEVAAVFVRRTGGFGVHKKVTR